MNTQNMSLRNRLENWLLRNVFRTVTDKMVMTYDSKSGVAYLGGDPIGSPEMRNLKEEVKLFERMELKKIIMNTLAHQANEIMTKQATSYEDMRHGKMILHTLGVQEGILNTIEKAKTLDSK